MESSEIYSYPCAECRSPLYQVFLHQARCQKPKVMRSVENAIHNEMALVVTFQQTPEDMVSKLPALIRPFQSDLINCSKSDKAYIADSFGGEYIQDTVYISIH